MADDNFRSNRSRDAAPRSAGAPLRGQGDDPLAELARLIGQSEPTRDLGRDAWRGPGPAFDDDDSVGGLDWVARDPYGDDRYAAQSEPAEESYEENNDAGDEERYAPAPRDDVLRSHRPGASSHDGEYEPQSIGQFSVPAPRFNGTRGYARDYAVPGQPRLLNEQEPPESLDRQRPTFLPQSRNERYAYDDHAQENPDDEAYAVEDHEEAVPVRRRRSGLIVVAAVLGLAVVGTAGAFAYRAMFGSSMLPSLPPIIKAEDGPNKILPSKPKANASDQADASANSGEKLVSREEQPVDMPAPVNPAPRVVSTIPIFPDPNSGQAGVPSSAQGGALAGGAAFPTPPAPAPPPQPHAVPTSPAASIWPPASATASGPAAGAAPAAPAALSTGPRKVHTVVIRSDQMGTATADALPAAVPPPPAPVRATPPRAALQAVPRPTPAPRAEPNGPLSIVPDQGSAAPGPAPRIRTALARPTELNAPAVAERTPSAAGSYAVQVTSQRSEAEAQAEFRALRAKFPSLLGGREPIVRRADLGAKGVFYRALVGPFASVEQAAGMCSSLKAAGGNCIVQRN